jgi:hypothetical protein
MKDSGLEPIIPPNESFDPGSLRRAEAGAISTQGDYGSQGAKERVCSEPRVAAVRL